jgi:hypothetical protein
VTSGFLGLFSSCILVTATSGACGKGERAPSGPVTVAPPAVPAGPRDAALVAPDAATEAHVEPPATIAAAVTQIVGELSESDKTTIRATRREDLITYHHGWGTNIRNELGLWGDNHALLADCGRADGIAHPHADDCSMLIIEAVWDALQDSHPRP